MILHLGTWHDFPASLGNPVIVLTFNSAEVVEALAAMPAPGEMLGQGDVYKIHLETRLGRKITYNFEITATVTVDEETKEYNSADSNDI